MAARPETDAATAESAPGEAGDGERAAPPSTLRENVEAIIVAFVLALLIRQYAVEAFVIPTGSMAPTLLGAHVDVECPNCGRAQPLGVSLEEGRTIGSPAPNGQGTCRRCNLEQTFFLSDDELTHAEVEKPCRRCQATVMARAIPAGAGGRTIEAWCPNCRFRWNPVFEGGKWPRGDVSRGDRILVDKLSYHVTSPARYEVAVFKFPQNPNENYIKRLIGLPGETIDVRDGDIYVRRPGDPPGEARIARKPEALQEQLWRPIHESRLLEKDPGGAPGDSRKRAWRAEGATTAPLDGGRGMRVEPAGGGAAAWLVYDRPIVDDNTYNEGRPGSGGTAAGEHPVGDVRVLLRVKPLGPGAAFHVRVTVDGAPLEVRLSGASDLSLRWASQDVPLARPVPARSGGPLEERLIDVWRYDALILLKVDGETVARLELDDRPREPETRKVEVRVGVSGAPAEVRELNVYKDVHYLERAGGGSRTRFPFPVPEGQYFFMGDNTSSSRDGREWGTVPASHLVGRAFIVFWPAVPGDLAVRRIR